MSRTILVPLDGSALADRAVPVAAALARRDHAGLVLIRAVSTREFTYASDLPGNAGQSLEATAAGLRERGIQVEVAVTPVGQAGGVPAAICDLAELHAADLIVMSTHGRGGLGRWIYGSVADAVLHRAGVPVLLVPAGWTRPWPAGREVRALVPLDGSPLAAEALPVAQSVADALLLAQVIEPINYLVPEAFMAVDLEADLAAARASLDSAAQPLRAQGVAVETEAVIGQVVAALGALAEARDADLLVMATHGRGGVPRLVLGSVATGLLQRAQLPILLVRPAAARPAEADAPARSERPIASVSFGLSLRELAVLEAALARSIADGTVPPADCETAADLAGRLRLVQTDVQAAAASVARATVLAR